MVVVPNGIPTHRACRPSLPQSLCTLFFWTQGFELAKQVLCCWATPPVNLFVFLWSWGLVISQAGLVIFLISASQVVRIPGRRHGCLAPCFVFLFVFFLVNNSVKKISWWLWFAFPWWVVTLSTFSHTCIFCPF
jgi:hypothetical protein